MADSHASELLLALVAAFAARLALAIREALNGSLARRRDRTAARAVLRREIGDFNDRVPRLVELTIADAFEDGNGRAEKRIGDLPERRKLSRINEQAIAVLVENLTGSLTDAATQIGRRADDVFRREGLRQALGQIADELPVSRAAEQLRERLEREGMVTFRDRAGRHWKLDAYARMVVRTVTAEARNQGVAAQMLARDFDLVEIIGHKNCNHHPGDPNHPCVRLPGKVLSLTGKTPGYEKLPSLPPWNPNCEHGILPAVEGVSRLLEQRGAVVA
jgi:hypothetical protein